MVLYDPHSIVFPQSLLMLVARYLVMGDYPFSHSQILQCSQPFHTVWFSLAVVNSVIFPVWPLLYLYSSFLVLL